MYTIIYKLMIAGLAIGALLSCDQQTEEQTSVTAVASSTDTILTSVVLTKEQVKNAEIKLGYLGDKKMSETIKVSGEIEVLPQDHAQVSTYIGGIIKSIKVKEGDYVKKGQTIMTIEHPDIIKLQQEYIASRNKLLFLEKENTRQKNLSENNAGTEKVFQETESKYETEKGNVASLKNQLSMLSLSTKTLDKGKIIRQIDLKAPIKGYIDNINISLGAYAAPNVPLFEVTDISNLIVHLDLFEKDIHRVKNGQQIRINLPNQSEREIEGEIISVGKKIDTKTKTVSLIASITEQQDVLIPGMFVSVYINVSNNNKKTLPADAVIRTGDKQYVFIATDAWCTRPDSLGIASPVNTPKTEMAKDSLSLTYEMVEVQTSASADGYVGIQAEKDISDYIVVIKGAYYLMSQLKSGETVGCCAEPENKTDK